MQKSACKRKLAITWVKICQVLCYQRNVDRMFEQATNHCAMMSHCRGPASKLLYNIVCKTIMQDSLKPGMLYRVHQIPELILKFIYVMTRTDYKYIQRRSFV